MLARIKNWIRPQPGRHLVSKFRHLNDPQLEVVADSLRTHYFHDSPPDYLAGNEGQRDLAAHLRGRLTQDRHRIVPWLDSLRPLAGSSVLEVGCGTGCSTVALAEQGARVTAVDLNEPALRVARTRRQAYGLEAEFLHANIIDALATWQERSFDFVIFFASLEHMTHQERIQSIRDSWRLLGPDSLWCVIETPNRLWYFDGHTSLLPFFMWLPDDLAFAYTRYSPRESLAEAFHENTPEEQLRFLRQGRGVSYHEFELALERPARELNVRSSLETHYAYIRWLRRLRWPRPRELRYSQLLQEVHPDVHPGFLQPQLDLALQPTRVDFAPRSGAQRSSR